VGYEVLTTEEFLKDVKSILKVYPGFKKDIQHAIAELQKNPEQGNHLGHGIYKLRVSITGKSSGKSYGARIIHLVITFHRKVYLLKAYDKSEKKDLTTEETKKLVARAKVLQINL
jgi:mRNA-degrading endonuclease RelE of RelBE toxin-antitoxin system